MSLTATEMHVLARVRDGLLAARRGAKQPIVDEAARTLGCSAQTVYRKLELAGLCSARKRRTDAGDSLMPDADLELLAGVLLASQNNKGQRMPVGVALDMLQASGQLTVQVHESTVARQLFRRHLHPEQLALPSPCLEMASLHPNHVWQIDSTTGAYYYLPGGKLRWMPEDEFYKNKVANLVKASTDLLTRYCSADHTSHAFKARYYLGGETAENLLDFVTWAMAKQGDSPLHGVPLMLIMDKGAANKGLLMTNFCKRVGIRLEHHAAGAARVTGSVEKAHDLVRMHFETRLRFVDPREVSLDWLNELICRWAAAHCTTKIHTRHGKARYAKWMEIEAQHLRVATLDNLREAAVREPESRRVGNDRVITFGRPSRDYDLSLVPGVVAGLRVMVAQNPFRAPAIDVLFTCPDTGAETWHVVEPAETDANGYRVGAPVWGEDMRTAAYSDVDHARGRLTRDAYKTGDGLPTIEQAAKARKAHAQAYAGVVDAMADINAAQVPTYLPRRGTPLELAARKVQARRLGLVEACAAVKVRLGPMYTPQIYADLAGEFGDAGVPDDQLDDICARYAQPAQAVGGLHAIGGGGAA